MSGHPKVCFSLRAIQPDGNHSDVVEVNGIADSGAQSNLWGFEDFKKSGLSLNILKPVTLKFRGVDKSQIQIIGGFNTICSGYSPNGDIIYCECTVYVSPNVSGFYISYETMVDLLILDRHFPTIGGHPQKHNPSNPPSNPPF